MDRAEDNSVALSTTTRRLTATAGVIFIFTSEDKCSFQSCLCKSSPTKLQYRAIIG